MTSGFVLLQLAGAIALLLFGLGLVRDGMTEVLGVRLKLALGVGTRTVPRAFISGLLATIGLQSSTATALMAASFVERDLIRSRMAQIALLGANVGTALTAWIVSTGVEQLGPVLVFVGYVMGLRKQLVWTGGGKAVIGIGLLLIAVMLLGNATEPVRTAPEIAAFLPLLADAWVVALIFAAIIAILCSSSLAAVLLILSLPLPPALVVVLVLGANLGGAVPAVLASWGVGVAARRVTLGNLLIRGIGCVIALPFAADIAVAVEALPFPGSGLAVEVHLVFNVVVALVFWPLAGPIGQLLVRLLPDRKSDGQDAALWLDEGVLDKPVVALAGASREVLAVGDMVERMLTQTWRAFREADPGPLADVALLEERVDRRQREVKAYLSRLGRTAGEEDRQRSIAILDYVINLEHVGDIIHKGLVPAVRKRAGLGLWLSSEGYAEIERLFLTTLENLRMAQTVFMTRDPALARRLMESKVDVRKIERQSAEQHLIRLRDDNPDSFETSSLHLDLLRDLKRITAHLVSAAHPILDEEGLLFESRLRSGKTVEGDAPGPDQTG